MTACDILLICASSNWPAIVLKWISCVSCINSWRQRTYITIRRTTNIPYPPHLIFTDRIIHDESAYAKPLSITTRFNSKQYTLFSHTINKHYPDVLNTRFDCPFRFNSIHGSGQRSTRNTSRTAFGIGLAKLVPMLHSSRWPVLFWGAKEEPCVRTCVHIVWSLWFWCASLCENIFYTCHHFVI